MADVRITGRRPGFQKVGMTKLLQARLGLGVAEAKAATDRALGGEAVKLSAPTAAAARHVAAELTSLGAVADVTDREAAT